MTEEQIEKVAQELSEEDLNDLAGGKKLTKKQKKILTGVGIAATIPVFPVTIGLSIAALVGWKTGKGAFKYLHEPDDAKNVQENK